MARIGSALAAPFVGDQFVSLYVGATRVPTVPGPPTITNVSPYPGGFYDSVFWNAPANNGGSAITAYKLYSEGEYDAGAQIDLFSANGSINNGVYQVSAVNAVGEGPLSDVYV